MPSVPRGGVAIDAAGNLYIADTGANRIVKLPPGGAAAELNITGLGTSLNAPLGLAVHAAGTLYIADSGNNRIVQVTSVGAGSALSISGLAKALSAPSGLAVDSFANVFIADSGNNRVVRASSSGAGSVPGTGGVTVNSPVAVALDVSGTIYVADTGNSRVASVMVSAVGFGELQVGSSSSNSFTLPFTIGVAVTLGSVQALTLGAQSLDFTLGAGTTCANGTTNTTCNVEVQFLPIASGLRRGAVAFFDQSQSIVAILPVYGTGGAPFAALSPGTASMPPLPFIVLASTKSTSPPVGVQAKPTVTPARFVRSAISPSVRILMPPRNQHGRRVPQFPVPASGGWGGQPLCWQLHSQQCGENCRRWRQRLDCQHGWDYSL